MNIRCLAIDDEPLALQQLVAYISKVPFLELAAQCQSAMEARDFLEHDTVDAIFCDINMPDLNGMDFVKQLVAPPLVVFTTAYSEYAIEGYPTKVIIDPDGKIVQQDMRGEGIDTLLRTVFK